MDVTYDMFRRLMVNWHQSIETRETKSDPDDPSQPGDPHARRLLVQCGYSAPCEDFGLKND